MRAKGAAQPVVLRTALEQWILQQKIGVKLLGSKEEVAFVRDPKNPQPSHRNRDLFLI